MHIVQGAPRPRRAHRDKGTSRGRQRCTAAMCARARVRHAPDTPRVTVPVAGGSVWISAGTHRVWVVRLEERDRISAVPPARRMTLVMTRRPPTTRPAVPRQAETRYRARMARAGHLVDGGLWLAVPAIVVLVVGVCAPLLGGDAAAGRDRRRSPGPPCRRRACAAGAERGGPGTPGRSRAVARPCRPRPSTAGDVPRQGKGRREGSRGDGIDQPRGPFPGRAIASPPAGAVTTFVR